MLRFFAIFACSVSLLGQPNVKDLTQRHDLVALAKDLSCGSKKQNSIEIMFSASEPLDLRLVAKNSLPRIGESLEGLAKILAKANHHHGFFFGECSADMAFIGSAPAPFAFSQQNLTKAMNPYCRSLSIDYARVSGGASQKTKLDPAVVSYTCYPRSSIELGPFLWYAKFTRPHQSLPLPPHLQGEIVDERDFLAWINRVRKYEGLGELSAIAGALRAQGIKMTEISGVEHSRNDLKKAKDNLLDGGYQFLGENRAVANNLHELAFLFWFSPRHRDLLLEKKADVFSLVQKPLKDANLYVALAAKRRS